MTLYCIQGSAPFTTGTPRPLRFPGAPRPDGFKPWDPVPPRPIGLKRRLPRRAWFKASF
ncbi:uncharacterized protein EI90DRAFT_3035170 [Cantharellus anzutake]|uniref:uncharacterized protein n=1 Tax=Cantharellus anzutake TaxID=1750568 RepID=UPI0019037FAB|nr:uncharacterized protein EI90DRAFT_3035170 [Cantharellus anzutake]KAF8340314.1 hypothetical protein EI90DRAFT_3035170 [Cantharellus anzutake]